MLNLFKPIKQIKIIYIVPKVGTNHLVPVVIKVYDEMGSEIAKLVNEEKTAGTHEVEFDVTGMKRGRYFYQVYAGCFVSVRRMIELT